MDRRERRRSRNLKGKPEPDTSLAGARLLGVEPVKQPYSKMRWRVSRRAGPAASGSWSVLTASATPTRCVSMARTLSSPILPICWMTRDPALRVCSRALGGA